MRRAIQTMGFLRFGNPGSFPNISHLFVKKYQRRGMLFEHPTHPLPACFFEENPLLAGGLELEVHHFVCIAGSVFDCLAFCCRGDSVLSI